MKRVVIVAMLMTGLVAAACVWDNKSDSLTVSNPSPAASPSPSPRIEYVTDSANLMDQSSRNQLETTLAAFKEREKIDFAVVTVGSTGNQSTADYSLDLARERNSKVHGAQDGGGLLLLVAVNDHKWHVQVSRNLEGKLTNEILTTLSQPMIDSFKQKRYGEGIVKYVNAIIGKLANPR